MVAADLIPRGPYSLELSARGANDATRSWRDGILDAELPSGRAVAWQHPDGRVTPMDGCDSVPVQAGDVFVIETPGGGGYGRTG